MAKIYDQINWKEEGIGYFPELERKLTHGFSWGKPARNMTFALGDQSNVTDDLSNLLAKLLAGTIINSINLIPEQQDRIVFLDEKTTLESTDNGYEVAGDAIFTTQTGKTLIIKPGDCAIAIVWATSRSGEAVTGLIHAGWRGIDENLPYKCVEYIKDKLGCDIKTIKIGITPHVSAKNQIFEHIDAIKNQENWYGGIKEKTDGFHLDLGLAFMGQLEASGVDSDNIEMYQVDTYEAALNNESFSHRASREHSELPNGRFAVVVRS